MIRIIVFCAIMWTPLTLQRLASSGHEQAIQIFKDLGISKLPDLSDYEVCIAVNLVDPTIISINWTSIGGLNSIISDIEQSVIAPLQSNLNLSLSSKLLQAPKGILLYGPPGCGKTMLARAMAGAANANFINLQISTLVSMWYGETQKYVEAAFSLAHKLQPSIIFIDEIDSFLSTRSHLDNEATRMIKTQFMALWDGILSANRVNILIVGATNRPQDLDQAILRRLPYKIYVPLPDFKQRVEILRIHLLNDTLGTNLTHADLDKIASKMNNLSGSDIVEVCREAAFILLRKGILGLLNPDHFTEALEKFKQHHNLGTLQSGPPLD